jgi:hypothetical protein
MKDYLCFLVNGMGTKTSVTFVNSPVLEDVDTDDVDMEDVELKGRMGA